MTKKKLAVLLTSLCLVLFGLTAMLSTEDQNVLDYSVYPVEGGWGYDITLQGKTVIHQPYIPATSGTSAFPDKASARETARVVIQKLQNGESPALTVQEVDAILTKE